MLRWIVTILGVLGFTLLTSTAVGAQDMVPASAFVLDGGSPTFADRTLGATVTQIAITDHGVIVDFTRKDGPNRWPDVVPPGWNGPIQYTLWIGMQLQGQWHACAVLEFWYGRGLNADVDAGGDPTHEDQIRRNWTYFCGPMARQPQPGESVAFWVTSGDQRRMDIAAIRERSNVVLIPFPASAPAVYPVSGLPTPTPTPNPTPIPVPPVVVPAPTPAPLPAIDLTPLLLTVQDVQARVINLAARIEELNVQVQQGRNENKAFFAAVGSEWKRILSYAGPIVAALFAGKKL